MELEKALEKKKELGLVSPSRVVDDVTMAHTPCQTPNQPSWYKLILIRQRIVYHIRLWSKQIIW